ncbi:MAG: phosphate ABC transporter permease subunit PstC, partial [Methanocorpusculum sp.]|nr:phosphate ABC transporter permease subunit PstC [Methanocorpusculum sp.]
MTNFLSAGLKENSIKAVWFFTALVSSLAVLFILGYLVINAVPIFTETGITGFLFSTDWNPAGSSPSYGVLALIVDTLLVTFGAMVIAVPLGIFSAVYLAYLAPRKLREVLKPVIELLAGIPSVVYGFFGMIVLCGFLQNMLDIPSGFSWLAASIILGIMALPTIVSVSEDALTAVPKDYTEGSLGLGTTKWQTISRVLIPAAFSGITAAVILGIGRAIGETMAVMMVAGNSAVIPSPIWDVLSPVRTLTATLGIEIGEVAVGSMHYYALFGVAAVLLVITLAVNVISSKITERLKTGKPLFTIPQKIKKMMLVTLAVLAFAFLIYAFGIFTAAVISVIAALIYFIHRKISCGTSQKIAFGLIISSVIITVGALVIILSNIFINGLPAISLEFLTSSPS